MQQQLLAVGDARVLPAEVQPCGCYHNGMLLQQSTLGAQLQGKKEYSPARGL